ncbi:MAG: dihydroorotate dehydrogenase B catalytic subunit [Deltaproteobacteria bacterium RIFOXYD12_FULL_50_9]|nr:MAG: dihydroorotate dehydrogenase B catalytic subunit [Deltaproteobacteria bacterium RIFOXYD12_FULL_50_9]
MAIIDEQLPDLQVNIGNLLLKNPVLTASGTFGYGREYQAYVNLSNLGGIVVKGISLEPRPGNLPPRIVETACGMLNAIGLENVGLKRFIAEKMPFLRDCGTQVLANILGDSVEEYCILAERLSEIDGLAGLEVNISCPNVKMGGVAFGTNPQMAYELIAALRGRSHLPLIVKLSPNVTDITKIAQAVADAGCDAVSLINTLLGMAIDIRSRRPRLANIVGGLSGPAIKPVALRMVWQVAKAVKIPVIGIGGISSAEDAIEFLLAGATAIQVGTANFVNPQVSVEIVAGISQYLQESGEANVRNIIGSLVIS